MCFNGVKILINIHPWVPHGEN